MCGIAGYTGKRPAAPLLVRALERLVYRGYDSAGLATINDHFHVLKGAGAVEQLEARLRLSELPGTIGLAHTRWATHGGVTDANAHPHLDCDGEVAVVHNGVFENHAEVRARLRERGHAFRSETDSEVLAHLVEEGLEAGALLPEAVREALAHLTGTYGVLVARTREPSRLVAARRGSPLVLAHTAHGSLAASDCLALLEHTRDVYFLEDGELGVLTPSRVEVFDPQGQRVAREPVEVPWRDEQTGRGGYDHFMLKEIHEQPRALAAALDQDPRALARFVEALRSAERVLLLACGTSHHACLLARQWIAPLVRAPVEAALASEAAHPPVPARGTLVLAVSQSGETMDVLAATRALKKAGARLLALVNVPGSSLARESEAALTLNCGPEIGVASTKAFLAQLAVFRLLAESLKGRPAAALAVLPALVSAAITLADQPARSLARRLAKEEHAYYLGRGSAQPLALEGALKLKEIACVHAEGFAGGELKHGPLALVRKGSPVLALVPSDGTREAMLTTAQETRARGAWVIGVAPEASDCFDELLPVPRLAGDAAAYYPFALVPALQLLAYHAAVARGANPDRPVNLAKSVTVH
jgi:glucosamine--fructose-6-phosphate aminotransferase (isomerizing)